MEGERLTANHHWRATNATSWSLTIAMRRNLVSESGKRVCYRALFVEQQINNAHLLSCGVVPRDLEGLLGLKLRQRQLQQFVEEDVRRLLEGKEHVLQTVHTAVLHGRGLRQIGVGIVHRETNAKGIAAKRLADAVCHLIVAPPLVHCDFQRAILLTHTLPVRQLGWQSVDVHNDPILYVLEELRNGTQWLVRERIRGAHQRDSRDVRHLGRFDCHCRRGAG